MSQPTAFDRQTSFALFSSEFPGEPHSGVDLDGEFNAVKLTLDETLANLALIQDDDGGLAEGCVGLAQLDESVSLGVRSAGVWVTATSYTADVETVFHTTKIYRCEETHTSGVFATDLAAGKWTELADLGVQVLDDDTVGPDELQDDAVTEDKIENAAVTEDKIASAAVTLPKLGLDVSTRLCPAGSITAFGGVSVPSGWLHCNGQSLLRTDYPLLFAAISTLHGAADVLHFNVPNMMGRVPVCMDGMNGVAAAAVTTTAVSGVDALTAGATGGSQSKTIAQTNLPIVSFVNSGIAVSDTRAFRTDIAVLKAGAATAPGAGGITAAATSKADIEVASGAIAISAQGTAASGGAGTALDIMPPSIVLAYIIKAH